MAIVSCKEQPEGRGGSFTATENTHTRVFLVITDSTTDSTVTVVSAVYLAYSVRAGSLHDEDLTARCHRMEPVDMGHGMQWIVTCQYSNSPEHRDASDDPYSDPAIVGPWDSDNYQEVAELDVDDKPILNSAGDPPDPPLMKDFSRRNVTVRKNVASVPEWFLDYEDAVNSDTFTVGGLTVPVGKALCKKTHISELKYRNGYGYYEVTTVIHFSKKGWKKRWPDIGFREKLTVGDVVTRVKIRFQNEDGEWEYPAAPVALDGNGQVLTDPTLDNAVYNEDEIHESLPFASLPLV